MQISDSLRLRTIKAMPNSVRVQPSVGAEFYGIFEREYLSVSAGELEIESRSPALRCRSSDVDSRTKDEVLTLSGHIVPNGADYRIFRLEPDGYGWTMVILRS